MVTFDHQDVGIEEKKHAEIVGFEDVEIDEQYYDEEVKIEDKEHEGW